MKARQFVYAARTSSKAGSYSLSRIKVKNNLFYPSTAEAVQQEAANDTAVMLPVQEENHDVFPLPKPRLGFKSSFPSLKFLPFYGTGAAAAGGKGKQVLCGDESARLRLCQAGGKGKQVPEPQAAAAVITIIDAKIQVISSRFSL